MSTPPLRLFFALPCPEEIRAPLAAWRDGLVIDGQPVAAANLHLTLAFLGSVPRARKAELLALGASLPRTPFELLLDRVERWRNGILHLAPTTIPPALPSLVQALQDALQVSGFELERRPFRPHLTLARHCRHAPDAEAQFAWPARELVLYSSENGPHGVHYRAIGRWPLDGERPLSD